MEYDTLIVGGGSAGCVLANRLTEDGQEQVLLVEAGPDYKSTDEIPEDIKEAAFAPQTHDWGYATTPQEHAAGKVVAVPRGKVIGGSSSTNYCFALRGRPADHDAWAALGNPGWSFEEVLPFYRKMENDPDGEDRWHGRTGPLPLRRHAIDSLTPTAAAFLESAKAEGFDVIDDCNAPTGIGAGAAPLTAEGGIRQSTAIAYLNPIRERKNLTVRGDAEVDRLVFDGSQVRGVRLISGEEIQAKRIILAAGSYGSPSILMRSGIGPTDHLTEVGIETLVDLPGVGSNLREHPVFWNIHAAKVPASEEIGAMFQLTFSIRAGEDEEDYDVHALPTAAVPTEALPPAFVAPVSDHPTGWDFIFFVSCVQPLSTGSVRLRSADPTEAPIIDPGLYTNPEDAKKVARGIEIARKIANTSPLSDLLVGEREPGPSVDPKALADSVRKAPAHYNHAVGSCRMGPDTDPDAVVDSRLKVRGVEGVWVADASVMPTIPRVPTNPATIMIAERASAWFTGVED